MNRPPLGLIVMLTVAMTLSTGLVSFGVVAIMTKDVQGEPVATPTLNDECPTFLMRSRDAQLDAAYTAGYHAASERAQSVQLGQAVTDCTRELMACRHPGGTP